MYIAEANRTMIYEVEICHTGRHTGTRATYKICRLRGIWGDQAQQPHFLF